MAGWWPNFFIAQCTHAGHVRALNQAMDGHRTHSLEVGIFEDPSSDYSFNFSCCISLCTSNVPKNPSFCSLQVDHKIAVRNVLYEFLVLPSLAWESTNSIMWPAHHLCWIQTIEKKFENFLANYQCK